jgi:uncharacterized protein DUF6894
MPRYFFHVAEGDAADLIRDSDGVVLDGEGEARKRAIALARNIVRGSGESLDGWKIVVAGEKGDQILVMPLSAISAQNILTWLQPGSLIAGCKYLFGLRPSDRFDAAAALGISIQAALMIILMIVSHSDSYRTASAPTEDRIVAVRFIPEASPEAIAEFMDRYKTVVIGSPRSGGFYRLRVSDPRLPKEDLAKLPARMMQDSIVELAATVE